VYDLLKHKLKLTSPHLSSRTTRTHHYVNQEHTGKVRLASDLICSSPKKVRIRSLAKRPIGTRGEANSRQGTASIGAANNHAAKLDSQAYKHYSDVTPGNNFFLLSSHLYSSATFQVLLASHPVTKDPTARHVPSSHTLQPICLDGRKNMFQSAKGKDRGTRSIQASKYLTLRREASSSTVMK
jgi:hypothetical protein